MMSTMNQKLTKAGANWVDGDRFFDRENELETLRERILDRNHTLITAQRRMGKTSLVRELLRRLEDEGEFATVFVDLEAANDAADAIAEIAIQSKTLESVWDRTRSFLTNRLLDASERIDEISISELRLKLRASIGAGTWQLDGDQVFEALAANDKPVVLAIDELPILINRMLKGHDYEITADRRVNTDQFLSWLRRNGQAHRNNVTLIVSGSIGLEPVLKQANLSAQANIYAPLDLKPWTEKTAIDCLDALARNYRLELPEEVTRAMCDHLRCCVPHHVQQFFDHLHQHLRSAKRNLATVDDVRHVYEQDLLSVRGHLELRHYEERLNTVLGPNLYTFALDLLTEAAVNDGYLTKENTQLHRQALASSADTSNDTFVDVVFALEHDGYLEPYSDGYRFVSKLLQDWWRARHGQFFTPIAKR